MVKIKYSLIFLLALPFVSAGQAGDELTLEKAWSLALDNYPLVKQKKLVDQTAAINIENLQKGFLPQVNLTGQASYQSDVTKIEAGIPGLNFNPPSRDQYKLLAEVNQVVYDGGLIKEQKLVQQLTAAVEKERIDVELYKVRDRISQLFMGVLYLDEQAKQIELVKNDIQMGIKRVEAQVANGVAFRSNLNMLKAEQLKTDQRLIEIKNSRKGLIDALSLFLGLPLPATQQLEKPLVPAMAGSQQISRPELLLFEEQAKLGSQQEKLIDARNLPRASLFAQSGYGRPGLNMLKNEFQPYFIGGVRLNWSLAGLYTKKKEKELVQVNKLIIEVQKENFLLATNTQLKQQEAEIHKLEQLIASDREIIALRQSVKEAAKAQLENAVITSSDYLREVNAEDQARQSLITHELQLLQAQITYNTILGK